MSQVIQTWSKPDFDSWILRDEADWCAINKPAGVPTAPSQHHPQDLSRWIKTIWPEAALAHRLDRLTSGLLIITKNKTAQRQWSRLFESGKVRKAYLALVFGRVRERGFIDIKIDPRLAHGKVKLFRGKSAQTQYKLVVYDEARDASLVLGQPITGRTHQIRAHFWAINHAMLGDDVYRSKTAKPEWARDLERPWLHAFRLECVLNGQKLDLQANIPDDIGQYLSQEQKISLAALG